MSKKSKDNGKKVKKVMRIDKKEREQKKAIAMLINATTVGWSMKKPLR